MRWPPWKHDPSHDDAAEEEARRRLIRVRAQWAEVNRAATELREGRTRNHLVEKAFAMRERGTR